jgi:hypothetical protein
MRRSRLGSILGGLLLAALLAPTGAMAAGAHGTAVATADPVIPTIRLDCRLVTSVLTDARRANVCRWSALEGADVAVYRLWRVVDDRPRDLIAALGSEQELRFADRNIARGHRYTYRVVAVGADGARLGISNRVVVHVGRPAEDLRFNCAFVIDGDRSGARCAWGESHRAAAVRYVLYRSVDGAAREKIYRTGLNGRRIFLDTDVAAGQTIRYAVVALSASGRVVGIGGPDQVIVPALAR